MDEGGAFQSCFEVTAVIGTVRRVVRIHELCSNIVCVAKRTKDQGNEWKRQGEKRKVKSCPPVIKNLEQLVLFICVQAVFMAVCFLYGWVMIKHK